MGNRATSRLVGCRQNLSNLVIIQLVYDELLQLVNYTHYYIVYYFNSFNINLKNSVNSVCCLQAEFTENTDKLLKSILNTQ